MNFNLASILKKILNESVTSDQVNDAINNKYQVIITYRDEDSNAIGKRLIEPYVYGASKAGNPVFRAFQYEGDTLRGKPKWKLFRLDRVESWMPTNNHFNQQPRDRQWNAQLYNQNGDLSMSVIYNQVKFDSDNNDNDDVFKTDFEKQLLKRKQQRQQSTPINIKDLTNNHNGPVQTPQLPQIDNTSNETNRGPVDTTSIYPKITDSEWNKDSQNNKEIRDNNINKRRDRRADNRVDSKPTWRKGSLNQYIQ